MKTKIIRNFNHANILLGKGHKIVHIDRDIRDRKYLIFEFEYSEELIKDLIAITPVKRD